MGVRQATVAPRTTGSVVLPEQMRSVMQDSCWHERKSGAGLTRHGIIVGGQRNCCPTIEAEGSDEFLAAPKVALA